MVSTILLFLQPRFAEWYFKYFSWVLISRGISGVVVIQIFDDEVECVEGAESTLEDPVDSSKLN